MTSTVTPIDADQLENPVVRDVAWATIDPYYAAEHDVAPDHVGSVVMTAARVEHPTYVDADLVVVAYPGAGYQMWIGYAGQRTADCIDLDAGGAQANDDPRFVAAVQRAVDLWQDDPDALGGALLATDGNPYRKEVE